MLEAKDRHLMRINKSNQKALNILRNYKSKTNEKENQKEKQKVVNEHGKE